MGRAGVPYVLSFSVIKKRFFVLLILYYTVGTKHPCILLKQKYVTIHIVSHIVF